MTCSNEYIVIIHFMILIVNILFGSKKRTCLLYDRSFFCRSATCVKNNIVYILCKDILYTLCKHIVYKFLLIEALIFLLNEDRCESDKPVSSGILAYLRQSSR